MAKITLRAPAGFGFLPTVYSHGWFQCPPFYWDADEKLLRRVVRDASGHPTVLRIRAPGRRAVEIRTETDSSSSDRPLSNADRTLLRWKVRHILQLDQDISGFHELCRRHEHLAAVPEIGAGRFLRCPTVWEELGKAICGTNVQWSQAVRMISLIAELGESTGSYHAWPTPDRVLEVGESELRERCRVGYRAPYIVELARGLSEGSIDLGPIERGELERAELRKAFLEVKGIGPATADYLMILNGFADRLSIDSAVYAYVTNRHFSGRRPTAAEIEALYEPYGEWRALAYWFEALQEWWWGPTEFDFASKPESG